MPDLPDDLRALLHERAEHAPPAPAPTEAYVRRVERRRTARGTAVAAAGSLAVTAVIVAGAAAMQPRPDPVQPAGPPLPPTSAPPAGDTEPCADLLTRADSSHAITKWDTRYDGPPLEEGAHGFAATVAEGGMAFEKDVYEADADVTCTLIARNGLVQHHYRLSETASAKTVWAFKTIKEGTAFVHHVDRPLGPGRYRLVCAIHPSLRADVVVR